MQVYIIWARSMAQTLYKGLSKSMYATSFNLYYSSTNEGLLTYIVSEGIES